MTLADKLLLVVVVIGILILFVLGAAPEAQR